MRRGTRAGVRPRWLLGRIAPASPLPPSITNPGTQVSIEGITLELQITATETTSWAVTGLPAGLSMSTGFGGGLITGTPTAAEETTVKVEAKGPGGNSSTTFTWRIEPAPIVTPPGEEVGPAAPGETLFAQDLYASLAPAAVGDGQNGYALLALCNAIGSMYRQPEEAVRALEGFDAQTQTFDIDRTPDFLIPFVGRAAGVAVTAGLSTDAQRAQVREGKAWHRGKLDQITAEIQRTLTGTKQVLYAFPGPWQIEVITQPAETPSTAATEAAGINAKPAGIVMTFAISTVPIIDQGTKTIDASTGKIDTAVLADVT